MIQTLNKEQAIKLYKEEISKDFVEPFPVYQEYQNAIENGTYKAYFYIEDNIPKAYIILQEKKDAIFIPWYAVFKEHRSKGIGTKALKEVKQVIGKDIILEVENEKNAETQNELETILKRIRFYEKLNFKKIEGIEYNLNGESYDIMILGKERTPNQIKEEIEQIYQNVLINQEELKIET